MEKDLYYLYWDGIRNELNEALIRKALHSELMRPTWWDYSDWYDSTTTMEIMAEPSQTKAVYQNGVLRATEFPPHL